MQIRQKPKKQSDKLTNNFKLDAQLSNQRLNRSCTSHCLLMRHSILSCLLHMMHQLIKQNYFPKRGILIKGLNHIQFLIIDEKRGIGVNNTQELYTISIYIVSFLFQISTQLKVLPLHCNFTLYFYNHSPIFFIDFTMLGQLFIIRSSSYGKKEQTEISQTSEIP